jgi:hypothetical protein
MIALRFICSRGDLPALNCGEGGPLCTIEVVLDHMQRKCAPFEGAVEGALRGGLGRCALCPSAEERTAKRTKIGVYNFR